MPATWKEQLSVFLELQKIDFRIFSLEKELAKVPEEKKSHEASFQDKKKSLQTSEEELKNLQMRLKERENELQTKEENIKKYESQQMQVKTNKEYSALTHEINGLKADCSVFEDEILKLMDEIEGQQKSVAQDRADIGEEEKVFHSQMSAMDKKLEEGKKEIAQLNKGRAGYISNVEKGTLGVYDKILKKRDGLAVTLLRGHSCGGCNTFLTPQTVNEILAGEKMINCETCGRILYQEA